jgi:hypothetical protein
MVVDDITAETLKQAVGTGFATGFFARQQPLELIPLGLERVSEYDYSAQEFVQRPVPQQIIDAHTQLGPPTLLATRRGTHINGAPLEHTAVTVGFNGNSAYRLVLVSIGALRGLFMSPSNLENGVRQLIVPGLVAVNEIPDRDGLAAVVEYIYRKRYFLSLKPIKRRP